MASRPVLWTSAFTSGLTAHLAAAEAGADYEIRFISLRKGEHQGAEFRAVNPKAQVPALQLGPGGRVITEVPAIVTYIARTHPAAGLLPDEPEEQAGTLEWVAWVHWWTASALQPFFAPRRFHPDEAGVKQAATARLREAYAHAEASLEGKEWIAGGPQRTLADLALFFLASAHRPLGVALEEFPRLAAHQARVAALPGVQAALRREREQG